MIFRNPLFLLLLPVVILLYLYLWRKEQNKKGAVRYSAVTALKKAPVSPRVKLARLLPRFRLVCLLLLIFVLARPQVGLKETIARQEGIDIVLALDVSTSMLAEDFIIRGSRRNRLEIVKEVTADFIAERPNDRIGLVIFARRPYFLSPLTWDHGFSVSRLQEIETGIIEDGTAVGSALATAVNRLRTSTAESKVVILLTDGVNNAGTIHPVTAVDALTALEFTAFPIEAGSREPVPFPVMDLWVGRVYQNMKTGLMKSFCNKWPKRPAGNIFMPITRTRWSRSF